MGKMKAACGAWLGDRGEGARRQPELGSRRVNIRFEVNGLDF